MTNRESHDRQEQGTRHKTHTVIVSYCTMSICDVNLNDVDVTFPQ